MRGSNLPEILPPEDRGSFKYGAGAGALFSRDAGKSVARTPSQFEAKSVQVVGDAGVHVVDANDWQG
jgi:hypothetical protein